MKEILKFESATVEECLKKAKFVYQKLNDSKFIALKENGIPLKEQKFLTMHQINNKLTEKEYVYVVGAKDSLSNFDPNKD